MKCISRQLNNAPLSVLLGPHSPVMDLAQFLEFTEGYYFVPLRIQKRVLAPIKNYRISIRKIRRECVQINSSQNSSPVLQRVSSFVQHQIHRHFFVRMFLKKCSDSLLCNLHGLIYRIVERPGGNEGKCHTFAAL